MLCQHLNWSINLLLFGHLMWLIGKNHDAGKDWGQEEKGATEDEMVGWHHWLSGHEFEETQGDSDVQRNLKSGLLQFRRLQRVGHDLATEQQQQYILSEKAIEILFERRKQFLRNVENREGVKENELVERRKKRVVQIYVTNIFVYLLCDSRHHLKGRIK